MAAPTTTSLLNCPTQPPTAGDVKHVVLSAFGCGAFQNPASFVAQAFRTALTQPYKPPANSNSTAAESVHRSTETETETLSTRAESLEVVAFAVSLANSGGAGRTDECRSQRGRSGACTLPIRTHPAAHFIITPILQPTS